MTLLIVAKWIDLACGCSRSVAGYASPGRQSVSWIISAGCDDHFDLIPADHVDQFLTVAGQGAQYGPVRRTI